MAATNTVNSNLPIRTPTVEELSGVAVVLGAQWGDEGKGKIVDLLATEADVVCRCQVSNGHIVERSNVIR